MKILIISQYWAPENGVPQRRWSWLTGILEAAGHSVTVIAPPPHYNRGPSVREWWKSGLFRARTEYKEINQVETVVRTGFFPAGKSLTQRILNQAAVAAAAIWVLIKKPGVLREYKPDLIIGSVPALPTAFVTLIASKRFRAPYVIDLRDAWPDLISEHGRWNSGLGAPSFREKLLSRGPVQVLGLITKWAMNFSLRNSDALIVTSSRLGKSLQERLARSNSDERIITVVRNVFPVEVKQHVPNIKKGSVGQLNVLYAGTLGRAQNLTNAIRAAAIAQASGYQVNLRFVGAGAARQELIRLARDLGVKAVFNSRLAAEDLAEQYNWADTALVHLTDWPALEQAVPSKTYELMACGIHICAIASGETKDLVETLEAGHVVAPESPEDLALLWIELIDDPNLLHVPQTGSRWVFEEMENVAPKALMRVIERFESD